MIGCIEPLLIGPFDTETLVNERVEEYREDPAESQNAHTILSVTKGSELNI